MTSRRRNGSAITVALGFAGAVLVAIGPPSRPRRPEPAKAVDRPSSVSGGGFELVTSSIDPPLDEPAFPAAEGVEALNRHCTSCHSPTMVLSQPLLTPEKWGGIVSKMIDAYGAPIETSEKRRIVVALTTLQATGERNAARFPTPGVGPRSPRPPIPPGNGE